MIMQCKYGYILMLSIVLMFLILHQSRVGIINRYHHFLALPKGTNNRNSSIGKDSTTQTPGIQHKRTEITIYDERRETLKKACMSHPYYRKSKLKTTKKYLLYNKKTDFLFCFVQKIGCTFWKSVFLRLDNKRLDGLNDSSLIHKMDIPTLPHEYKGEEVKEHSRKSFSVMFVRDPYERLFSAFVDKFVHINTHYWTVYGTRIISQYRQRASERSLRCGHDVTFSEFVHYVVETYNYKPLILDDHFSPIYKHCRPCEIDFKIIGKMETFEADARYVLDELNMDSIDIKQNTHDMFSQITQSIRHYKEQSNACLSDAEVSERVSKVLRYRGMKNRINNTKLSFTSMSLSNINSFVRLVQKSPRQERRGYMVEHYRSLDRKLLQEIKEFLKPDCRLFGYDDQPSDIFTV